MSVPNKAQVRAGKLWNIYVHGWADGAAVKAIDLKVNVHHDDPKIIAAYERGYQAGRDARNIASQDAAMIYGYEPKFIDLAGRPRCGVEGCRLPPDHDGLHKFGGNIP